MFRNICFIIALAITAGGQPVPDSRKAGPLNLQGSLRTRFEGWDWFQGEANGVYALSGNLLRVSVDQKLNRFDWQLELAAPFLLGLPEDAVAPGAQGQLGLGATQFVANSRSRNAGMIFAKQAFVRFKGLVGDPAQSLRIGRFEFSDGAEVIPADATLAALKRDRIAQRLIGPFGWSHVGRSFDGAHYMASRGPTNLTVMAALPTRGAFQVDGWGNLNVGIAYAALTRQLKNNIGVSDWRAFGIYYHDWRNVTKVDNRRAAERNLDHANIRIGAFGGHFLHSASTSAGQVDAVLWGTIQTGRWGRLNHSAGAYVAEGGWQPAWMKRIKPWLRAGYSRTTGDTNPQDSEHGTFFQFLPTPRPYARFPFFNMMNNQDAFAELRLRPAKSVTIRTEFHDLRLSAASDLWYLGGGAFQPWTFGYTGRAVPSGNALARLCDISFDYAINPRVALSVYFARALGRNAIRSIYPNGQNGSFGYLELTYKF